MKRKIITTGDGSKTIQIEEWNEQYHSKHGALQEALYVFIKSGLLHFLTTNKTKLSILEIGFGTGLNT
ncbi:MAG: SAM-dependent methyltransferase, partial [Flavobacteriaceae bacterium]|nr:SAM-dependent methyltransferase [Flavobacteriaceae bacterium]